jgi:formylglycine-generating enzyme
MINKSFSIFSLLAIIVLSSCGGSSKQNGQLVGVANRPKWSNPNILGMVYVPSGQVHLGQSDQDIFGTDLAKAKSVSLQGFYMDDTEITNNEYRQFIYYVRDETAHKILGDLIPSETGGEDEIDWEIEIDYSDPALDEMFYAGDMALNGNRELNTEKLKYSYKWLDWQKAAQRGVERTQVIRKEETKIYPDTMSWIRDFAYSYNEPFTRNYFWHPSFDDYPVVGVNWNQAMAFCDWRTKFYDKYKGEDEVNTEVYRLPSEAEWEYAARGGKDLAPYPWGGPYVRNKKGCLLANFKPGRGNYAEDGGLYTVKTASYFPNDYGLYDMSGNVSEWTSSSYVENAYGHEHDLNPDVRINAVEGDPEYKKRKVVRGGSWKDISYYLQTGTRAYEYQDTTKSYLGFRTVLTYLGRSINDFN